MEKSLKKKVLSFCALSLAGLVLVGCNNGAASSTGSSSSNTSGGSSSSGEKKFYTYHDALTGSPETWNVCTWQTDTDQVIMNYTQIGLYDFALNAAKTGYEAIPEMAASEAVDDTANLTNDNQELYGLTTKENGDLYSSGQKWIINLNQAATWEDGTAINADTYINSMKDMLDPTMQNYRASSYTSSTLSIGNADGYLKSGTVSYNARLDANGASVTLSPISNSIYFSIWSDIPFLDQSQAYANTLGVAGTKYATDFPKAAALVSDAATWGTLASPKYVELTSANSQAIADALAEFLQGVYSASASVSTSLDVTNLTKWPVVSLGDFGLVPVKNPIVSWDKVGLQKTGDYQLTFFLKNPISLFQLHYALAGGWLVKQDLFDAGKKTVGTLVTTTYGTSAATYSSYGPYKLASYQADKDIYITRNDKWYGYTDGKHTGEFQTDAIDIQIVASEDTVKQMFLKGDLDSYSLRSTDMKDFGSSSRLLYTPQSYTTKLNTNSDFSTLKGVQDKKKDGNHTILSNINFRKALSLGIDRQTLAQTQTAGSKGYDVPINSMYVANENTGELYRNTNQGKKVVTDNFGTDSEGNPNYYGYDLDEARKLINQAVTEEETKAAANPTSGYYTSDQNVALYWEVYNNGWDDMVTWIKGQYTNLFKGTLLDGKFTISTSYNEEYSDHVKDGSSDLGMVTWGGAEFDPYSIPQVYIDANYKDEPGLDNSTELAIDVEGKGVATDKVTMSLKDWDLALRTGKYSAGQGATYSERLNILSALESYLVGQYNFVSLYARQSVSIDSYRIQEATDTYFQLVGYGGIRFQKITKSDSEWNTWVAANSTNGALDYNK